jgi:hypothetical protein
LDAAASGNPSRQQQKAAGGEESSTSQPISQQCSWTLEVTASMTRRVKNEGPDFKMLQ